MPSPKDITDEQLLVLLESGDPTQYRVPLSLGEPHTEKDNCKWANPFNLLGVIMYTLQLERTALYMML